MVLGLRALVAAGAESVMVLYTERQHVFQPERSEEGKLLNSPAFEHFIREVQGRGNCNEFLKLQELLPSTSPRFC